MNHQQSTEVEINASNIGQIFSGAIKALKTASPQRDFLIPAKHLRKWLLFVGYDKKYVDNLMRRLKRRAIL